MIIWISIIVILDTILIGKALRENKNALKEIRWIRIRINHVFHKRPSTDLILTTTINQVTIKIYDMKLDVNGFLNTHLKLVDHDTQEPIEATFSDVVLTSSDETIFTVGDKDADGNPDVDGVAEGAASLNVKCNASYTDKNTQQPVTVPKEVDVPVTVSKPAPEAETTDLVVEFGN